MLIDTKQIITKTELREDLTQALMLVEKGQELMISDRGKIKAKLAPVTTDGSQGKRISTLLSDIKKLRKEISAENPDFNSLKALKEVRAEN